MSGGTAGEYGSQNCFILIFLFYCGPPTIYLGVIGL